MSGEYEIAHHYWSHQKAGSPELFGVADIGGGGVTEVLYRHHEELRRLRRIISIDKEKSVLELGCGNGRWVVSLAPLVKHYVAVDFSSQMLEMARKRAAQLRLTNITFCQTAAQDFFPKDNFDIIYLAGVSQYLHDADLAQLLQRLLPRLSPGGVIVDRSTIHCWRYCFSEQPGYFCIYRTAAELIRLFESAGLVNTYRKESYRFLNFPATVQKLLWRRRTARLVAATAPLSFMLLRMAAFLGRFFLKSGETAPYSHDFFLFQKRNDGNPRV